MTVTGKFGKEASERGTVTSKFSTKNCDASATYVGVTGHNYFVDGGQGAF